MRDDEGDVFGSADNGVGLFLQSLSLSRAGAKWCSEHLEWSDPAVVSVNAPVLDMTIIRGVDQGKQSIGTRLVGPLG